MDYSQLSDFEINNLVALAIGSKVTDSYRVGSERETIYYSLGEDEFCVKRGYGSFVSQFDPCNNPADAWPIISDNRISLMYDKSTEEGNEAQWCLASSPCDQHIVDYVSESKLLRAAMIVFLMMQDAKHA